MSLATFTADGTPLLNSQSKKKAAEERAKCFADIQAGREYSFLHNIGDRVQTNNWHTGGPEHYIVKSRYIENGEARYILYPPGKKQSLGYHIWVLETEIKKR